MRLIGLAVVLILALAIGSFASEAQEVDTPASLREAYRIGPEDVLRISVWKNDGLSGTVTVRLDGKI